MAKYDPNQYWEDRLSKNFSLGGVGHLSLGVEYNKWLYKAKLRALSKLLKDRRLNPAGKRILDIGVGTGFYIDYWSSLGADFIVGLDITDKSISVLKKKYPEHTFIRADISDKKPDFMNEKFDIITAFDVLYHIVQEDKFEQALINIRALSHQDTQVFISDCFLKEYRSPHFHENDRTMARYEKALDRAEFRLVEIVPIFVLMNNPIDKIRLNSCLLRALAVLTWAVIRKLPLLRRRLGPVGAAIGYIIGFILYTADGIILKYIKVGPSTKLMLVAIK